MPVWRFPCTLEVEEYNARTGLRLGKWRVKSTQLTLEYDPDSPSPTLWIPKADKNLGLPVSSKICIMFSK